MRSTDAGAASSRPSSDAEPTVLPDERASLHHMDTGSRKIYSLAEALHLKKPFVLFVLLPVSFLFSVREFQAEQL